MQAPTGSASRLGATKGAGFREFMIGYQAAVGASELSHRLSQLEAGPRARLDLTQKGLGIISSDWYPAEIVHPLLAALFDGMSSERRAQVLAQAARHALDVTLKGIYRTLFEWMASPERYARHANKLWRTYHQTGTMTVRMDSKRSALCEIRSWSGHHPIFCEMNIHAARELYLAMNCIEVETRRTGCCTQGAAACIYVTTWR